MSRLLVGLYASMRSKGRRDWHGGRGVCKSVWGCLGWRLVTTNFVMCFQLNVSGLLLGCIFKGNKRCYTKCCQFSEWQLVSLAVFQQCPYTLSLRVLFQIQFQNWDSESCLISLSLNKVTLSCYNLCILLSVQYLVFVWICASWPKLLCTCVCALLSSILGCPHV